MAAAAATPLQDGSPLIRGNSGASGIGVDAGHMLGGPLAPAAGGSVTGRSDEELQAAQAGKAPMTLEQEAALEAQHAAQAQSSLQVVSQMYESHFANC